MQETGRGHRDWAKLHTQSLWPLTQQLSLLPSSSSHLLALADRLLAAVAPISSCPWYCQGAFSSSSLLLPPESCLWNGRQPRHYPQDPHLGCSTGFLLKAPTSDLLAAPVLGQGNCLPVGSVHGEHHPSNTLPVQMQAGISKRSLCSVVPWWHSMCHVICERMPTLPQIVCWASALYSKYRDDKFHFTAEDAEVGYGNYLLSSFLGKVLAGCKNRCKTADLEKMCLVTSHNFNNRPQAVRKEAVSWDVC